MTAFDRRSLVRLAELLAVLALDRWFSPGVQAIAGYFHVTLPLMPIVRYAYLQFTLVLLICLYIRLKGETFSEFGLIRPTRWGRYVLIAVGILIVSLAFDTVVRPLLDPVVAHVTGANPKLAEQTFASLKGNLPVLLFLLPLAWLFGGFGEEMLFRGFMMTRIAQLLGESRWAWTAAVFIQAIPFALGHGYQGPVGIVAVYVAALITGAGSLVFGRNLWPVIIAHGLQDSLAFVAIYSGIAHA